MKFKIKPVDKTQYHRRKVDPFYNSKEWKRLRNDVWKRDGDGLSGLCAICKSNNKEHVLVRYTKDLNIQGTVDHIKPRNAGGSDTLNNLRLVGSRCHAGKSNQDKKHYGYR